MSEIIDISSDTAEAIESFERLKQEKSKYKNPIESIVNSDFTHRLYEAGKAEMERMWEVYHEAVKEKKNMRKPTKINPITVAYILKQHTRFVQLKTNRTDNNPPVYLYNEDEGIYTNNRAMIDRYMRIVEGKLSRHDQNEIYNFLQDTAEVVELTKDRYLIPVNNGIFDLRTKELKSFSSEYVFTSKVKTDYVDNPEHPDFDDGWNIEDWIMEIANDDVEVFILLWQVIADAINGNYSRKRSIWLVGDGSNGKGTYQDLIRHLVGTENVAGLKIDQFSSNNSGQNFNLAMLEGKTVNIGDDVQSNAYVDDSSNFNSVVTGDPVIVEHKGKGGYVVEFNLTVIQSTNGLPRIKNKTHGTYRRMLIVPFLATFDGVGANYDIKEKYIKDKRVLEFVLHKAINLDFEDFDIPSASKRMLEEYKVSNDPVREFVEETFSEIMEDNDLDRIPKQTAHDLFKQFCKDKNYQQVGYNNFITQFEKMILSDYEEKTIRWLKDNGEIRFKIPIDSTHPERNKTYRGYIKK